MELIGTLLDTGVLIPGLVLSFGFVVTYLLLSAKHNVPITVKEAETHWKFHKESKCCNAETWDEINKNKKLIGFECECGYSLIQKKPLINLH